MKALMIIALTLSIAACKASDTQPDAPSTPAVTPSQPTTTQPDVAQPTPVAVTPDPVVVPDPIVVTPPTIDPAHACAGFAALGTWVNVTDATDVLVFNDDCTMSAVYCNETFSYQMPPTTSLTHASVDFATNHTGAVDPTSTAFSTHRSACEPFNHINQQTRDMYYSTLAPSPINNQPNLPSDQLQFTWRYDGGAVPNGTVYQKVQ